MDSISIEQRKKNFIAQLNLSDTTTRNYITALNSSLLKEMLLEECDGKQLFEINDLDELWKLYSKINVHPRNISTHRICSAAVMKYIKYLNGGKKYGKRIDFNRSRPKK